MITVTATAANKAALDMPARGRRQEQTLDEFVLSFMECAIQERWEIRPDSLEVLPTPGRLFGREIGGGEPVIPQRPYPLSITNSHISVTANLGDGAAESKHHYFYHSYGRHKWFGMRSPSQHFHANAVGRVQPRAANRTLWRRVNAEANHPRPAIGI